MLYVSYILIKWPTGTNYSKRYKKTPQFSTLIGTSSDLFFCLPSDSALFRSSLVHLAWFNVHDIILRNSCLLLDSLPQPTQLIKPPDFIPPNPRHHKGGTHLLRRVIC